MVENCISTFGIVALLSLITPVTLGMFQKYLPRLSKNGLLQNMMVTVPSGKRLHNYGKSPFSMGKLTISMVIFNSYVYVYQRVIFSVPIRF
jgi:hypothetical protein